MLESVMAYVNCLASVLVVGAIVGQFMVNYDLLDYFMAYVNCIASVLMVRERLSAIHGDLQFA